MLTIIKIGVKLGLILFLIQSTLVCIDGLYDKKTKAVVGIVLGNKIDADGSPSERLRARLDKSIELYRTKRIQTILVSGGFGKEGFWEGEKMKDYLVLNHIPMEKIMVDNYGNDTEKTVINSIRIMDSLHYKSAITISQYFHQTRTKALFRNNGFYHIESASPIYFEWRDSYSVFREFVAYYKEAL
ncbi:MAG: YdcF family protein [Sphingobacterium sp.]|jgi:vancomycin permeability regulator SanA|nr:YdcF family protein [Sphingobacterium sp.]